MERRVMGASRVLLVALAAYAGVCFVPGINPAAAQLANPRGDWAIGASKDDKGAFSYCVAQAVYDSNQVLIVVRAPNNSILIGIGLPGGKLATGRAPATVKIDTKITRNVQAGVGKPDLIEVPLGEDEELFKGLRTGSSITIETGGKTYAFALKGTGKALTNLMTCVTSKGKNGLTEAAAPASGARPTANASPIPASLARVLASVGFEAQVPLAASDRVRAWGVGPILGIVEQVKVDGKQDMKAITENYIAEVKKNCKGTFDSDFDSVETVAKGQLRTGSLQCSGEGKGVYRSLILYRPAADGDLIIFRMADVRLSDADKTGVDRDRDAVKEAIKKAAAS